MALQYTPRRGETVQAPPSSPAVEEPKPYDVALQRKEMTQTLVGSKEVDDLVSQIVVDDPQTIVSFGSEVANEIAKCSDTILNSINMSQINDSGEMLNALGNIMDKFDIEEIAADEKKGFFSKLFNNLQKQLEQILAKYHTMGEEVDRIYIQLKKYEVKSGSLTKSCKPSSTPTWGFIRILSNIFWPANRGCRKWIRI